MISHAFATVFPTMRWFSRLPLFWQIQLGGWLLFMLCTFPLKLYAFGTYQAALVVSFYREPLGMLLTTGLREIYRRIDRRRLSWFRLFLLMLVTAVSCGLLDTLGGAAIIEQLGVRSPGMGDTLFLVGIFRSMLFFAWSMLYFWIKALSEARERELRLSRAETRQREAELQMLRAQINPHFLFNSLNTVIAGLHREQTTLHAVVQGLADYLRYALAHRDASRVPLGEEFDAIVNYLIVEKARFGDDLQIETALDETLRATLVPGVLLQPLVENALKHGWHSSEPPLHLRLTVQRDDSRHLLIEVANTGEWLDPNGAKPHGVGGAGLENIRRRLTLLYPGSHEFEVAGRHGWVVARISLSEA